MESLLYSLFGGALGALLVTALFPPHFAYNDRVLMTFNLGFLPGALGLLLLLRLNRENRWSGCITGPVLMFAWTTAWAVGLDVRNGCLFAPVVLLAVVGASWVALPRLSLIDFLGFLVYAGVLTGVAVWIAGMWPNTNILWLSGVMGVYALGVIGMLLVARYLGRPREVAPRKPKREDLNLPPGAGLPPCLPVFTNGENAICFATPQRSWVYAGEGRWEPIRYQGRPEPPLQILRVGPTVHGDIVVYTDAVPQPGVMGPLPYNIYLLRGREWHPLSDPVDLVSLWDHSE